MNNWKSVLKETPVDITGETYDVWTSEGERIVNVAYIGGEWKRWSIFHGWQKIKSNITHFMPSPKPPKDLS